MVGTPVIGFGNGATPEIVTDGVTGVLGTTVDELIRRIYELDNIDPDTCRKDILKKFSVEKYIKELENILENIIKGEIWY